MSHRWREVAMSKIAMPKVTMPYQKGPAGGTDGGPFDDFAKLGGPADAYVNSLQVNHGSTLDHLVVTYSQCPKWSQSAPHGVQRFRFIKRLASSLRYLHVDLVRRYLQVEDRASSITSRRH